MSAKWGLSLSWLVVMLLSVGVGGYALFLTMTGYAALPLSNPMLDPWGLRTHVTASGVALLLGAFQFYKPLRRKAPALHRITGRIYVAGCLIGGLAGGIIALSSTAGPVAGWGFLILAVLWTFVTVMALLCALRRDFAAHERWMIRSFALTFAAVTLRIYLPLSSALNHGFSLDAYRMIAWAAWAPNLVIAEIMIASLQKRRGQASASQAAPS